MQYTRTLASICLSILCGSLAIAADDSTMSHSSDGMWGYRAPANYLNLPRPPKHSVFGKQQEQPIPSPLPIIQSRPTEPYAYGWFGTQSQQHWYRDFGTRHTHTQWTLR
jgi:hypothetical protein